MRRILPLTALAILILQAPASPAQSWGQLKSAALEAESTKNYDEAVAYWKKALASCPEQSGPRLEQSLAGLGHAYQCANKFTEAENCYKQLVPLLNAETLSGEAKSAIRDYQTLMRQEKREQEANELESKFALTKAPGAKVENSSSKADTREAPDWRSLLEMGSTEFNQKRYDKAEDAYKQALSLAESEKNLQKESETLNKLISLCYAQNKLSAAEAYYQRSLILTGKFLGVQSKEYAQALSGHAELLRKLNRKAEAMTEEAKAEQIRNKYLLQQSAGRAGNADSGKQNNPAATRSGSIYSRARAAQQGSGNPADELLNSPD